MPLNDWVNGILGGTPLDATRLNGRDALLKAALMQAASDPEKMFAGAIQYDGDETPISAVIKWPDGIGGNYSGTASLTFPGSVDAYTVTWLGSPVETYTQPAVTRDATTGAVTNRPAITVS